MWFAKPQKLPLCRRLPESISLHLFQDYRFSKWLWEGIVSWLNWYTLRSTAKMSWNDMVCVQRATKSALRDHLNVLGSVERNKCANFQTYQCNHYDREASLRRLNRKQIIKIALGSSRRTILFNQIPALLCTYIFLAHLCGP